MADRNATYLDEDCCIELPYLQRERGPILHVSSRTSRAVDNAIATYSFVPN